jgi:NDP-sugar pyrophosphorylase family protein|tara:strand:+ start:10769 stop:11032 length:264 start_codon:yes stop_codon:yes gene_type:complete
MKKELASKFIKKKLISLDTEVKVTHTVQDFGGNNMDKDDYYNIVEIREKEFIGTSCVNGELLAFKPEAIKMIDGMSPERLGQAFKIK